MALSLRNHRVLPPRIGPLLISAFLLHSAMLGVGLAAVTSAITGDGSMGTAVTQTQNAYTISGGTITGSNLFHSFGRFSVGTGDQATFTGPPAIANIVSRVTGGELSMIDGLLRSDIAGANLYLLNPSGVLFGPNARLEVSGSFHVSTADFLRFADGATFSTHLGQESVLTVASPTAFGFLGNNPAAITIQGSRLRVPEGKAMSVVGGDIQIQGNPNLPSFRIPTLGASGGRIQLASVASPGEALFNPLELAPDLQVHSFARLGRLTLSQGAFIDTNGNGGGTVLLRGDHLLLDNALVSASNTGNANSPGLGIDVQGRGDVTLNGGFLLTGSELTSRGSVGEIRVHGGTVTLTDGSIIGGLAQGFGKAGDVTVSATESIVISSPNTGILTVAAGDPGRISLSAPTVTIDGGSVGAPSIEPGQRAGDISVEAGHFSIIGGGLMTTRTSTEQHGGDITINASESISISGFLQNGTEVFLSSIISATTGRGNAGRISLSTPRLTMDAGLISASTFGDGHAGDIDVRVGQLALTGGALLSSNTFGTGHGGELRVVATDTISISGRSHDGRHSGLISSASDRGNAGRLFISAPLLTMDDGFIEADTLGDGNAGNIVMEVGRLVLTGGAQISSGTRGTGHGGEVSVVATDAISISGRSHDGKPSGLFSNTFGRGSAGRLFVSTPLLTIDEGLIQAVADADSIGNAGGIDVLVGRLTLSGGAQIDSSTRGPGRGGDVTVVATEEISIAGHDREDMRIRSGLFSTANASGNAGRLFVSAPLLLIDRGSIIASTLGDGDAGDIEVRAGRLTLIDGAQIFSGIGTAEDDVVSGTGGPGRGGNVTVIATDAISIAGRDGQGFRSSIGSNALIGRGDAGNIFIATPYLEMRDGFISTGTFRESRGNAGDLRLEVGRLTLMDGARISSSTDGTGQGGTVEIAAADSIFIAGRSLDGNRSGVFSETGGPGQGGSIQLRGRHLDLSDGGIISASSTGDGAAGALQLHVDETFRSQQGAVTTAAERAGGGTISLRAGRLVQLIDSEITTSVRGGGGDAGNISLNALFIVLEGSQLIANAFEGVGGNIRLEAEVFLADPASLVSASSALGLQGTVDIRAPVTSLSGTLAPLPQAFVSVAALLPARCAARASGGVYSSLVVGGRGGLPPEPGGLFSSPLTLDSQVSIVFQGSVEPRRHQSVSRGSLLYVADKVFPRLQRELPQGNTPLALTWSCSR